MENEKITTEELYGKSDLPQKPLVYEETPIIGPASPAGGPVASPPPLSQLPKHSGSFLQAIGTILLFIILFGVGVWLSTVIRQYLPTTPTQPEPTRTPSPVETPAPYVIPTVTNDQFAGWQIYTVSDVSFRLPEGVLAPICDGANCVSEGTYLTGGTRFTVAMHNNASQFSQGAVIVDNGGREFTTSETTVSSRRAFSYQGLFSGTTTGGYSFSQMRGVMIVLDDIRTLELNHFTPTGVFADFASDDRIFDDILQTLLLP